MSPVVKCICGASLDAAPSDGVWTAGGIACEYRTCLSCRSTRAYAPADVVSGLQVDLYGLEPDATNCDDVTRSYETLLDALADDPPRPGAELRRGSGVLLATTYQGVDGQLGWKIAKPEEEKPWPTKQPQQTIPYTKRPP